MRKRSNWRDRVRSCRSAAFVMSALTMTIAATAQSAWAEGTSPGANGAPVMFNVSAMSSPLDGGSCEVSSSMVLPPARLTNALGAAAAAPPSLPSGLTIWPFLLATSLRPSSVEQATPASASWASAHARPSHRDRLSLFARTHPWSPPTSPEPSSFAISPWLATCRRSGFDWPTRAARRKRGPGCPRDKSAGTWSASSSPRGLEARSTVC